MWALARKVKIYLNLVYLCLVYFFLFHAFILLISCLIKFIKNLMIFQKKIFSTGGGGGGGGGGEDFLVGGMIS